MAFADDLTDLLRGLQHTGAPSVRRFVVPAGEPLPPEVADYRRQRPDGFVILRRIVRVPGGRNARATLTPAAPDGGPR